MKNDLEDKKRVPALLISRRKLMLAAAATGGAGMLSAGLLPISAQGERRQGAGVHGRRERDRGCGR